MKQKTIKSVIEAFDDSPKAISQRLEDLGISKRDFEGKFSKDLLSMQVYGSSFLKFLQENSRIFTTNDPVEAQPLPSDFVNPFDDGSMSVGKRLSILGVVGKDALFSKDVLDLQVNGDEFQNFIAQNQEKFIREIGKMAGVGGQNDS